MTHKCSVHKPNILLTLSSYFNIHGILPNFFREVLILPCAKALVLVSAQAAGLIVGRYQRLRDITGQLGIENMH